MARGLATAVEWKTVLGIIALRAVDPVTNTPPLVLLPLFFTSVRYGPRGLLAGTGAALLTIVLLTGIQVWVLHVLDTSAGRSTLVGRALLVLGMGIALGAQQEWQRREATRAARYRAQREARRGLLKADDQVTVTPSVRLTEREAEVLALLLATEGERRLSRKEIARHLTVSEDTVKTHMRHLAHKLGAEAASREAIHRAVHRRGWGTPPPARSDDNGWGQGLTPRHPCPPPRKSPLEIPLRSPLGGLSPLADPRYADC